MATTSRRLVGATRVSNAVYKNGERTSTVTVPSNSAETLLSLVLDGSKISVDIPHDATLTQVEVTLKTALGGYRRLSEAAEQLKPIIGRILLTIADRKLFRPDFPNLTKYIEERVVAVPWGISRTNAFEALRIARAFPTMSEVEYQRYGASRLLLASSVVEKTDGVKDLLDKATRGTVEAFREVVKDLQGKEPATTFVVSLRLPLAYKEVWEQLLTDTQLAPGPLVQELIQGYVEAHQGDVAEPALVKKAGG